MQIAYVNTHYQQHHTGGGHVHMEQFISNAIALGHEVWAYPGNSHPGVKIIPTDRINHIKTMHRMDALYVRVESTFPEICRWSLAPRRALYGFPIVVWEFNTTPEHGLSRGISEREVQKNIQAFQYYGKGCDLAICMTQSLADYVHEKLGIKRILIVPNASDPDLFKPGIPVVRRLEPFSEHFNVVWIGSGKEKWHNLGMLRDAADILYRTHPGKPIAFHIIGPDLAGIMADMPGNVYYWGAEQYNRLPNWLAGMHVGLNLLHPGPSDHNAPLKVFDYMASGLPVLSTPQQFMTMVADSLQESELIIPSGSPLNLAQTILRLAEDRETTKRIGLAGRQLVIDKYNWRKSVSDTLDELEKILNEKGRSPKN